MKAFFASTVACLGILTFASCKHEDPKVKEPETFVLSDSMRNMITVDSVRHASISDDIALTGDVSFNENTVVKVFPRSSGQVIQSNVSLGDHVTKGQVLAVIRSADVAGNYSDLSSTNADLAIAKRQLDNAEQLYKGGISSEREYTEARENYAKAKAAQSKVQSLISINGGSNSSASGQYVLTAPIDGFIVEKKLNAGNFIRPDAGENVFTISDLKTVWIEANVYESDISKVREGFPSEVKVPAYPDRTFRGRIDKLSQVLDPQSKALRARISIDNSELLLKPDMFAKVVVRNIIGEEGVCVPTNALINDNGRNYVIVYNGPNDLQVAQVKIQKDGPVNTFVHTGVTPGQRVVTKFQNLIFTQLTGN